MARFLSMLLGSVDWADLRRDLLFVVGATLMFVGIRQVHGPTSLILLGAVLLLVAWRS
jgi:hypothetical protein